MFRYGAEAISGPASCTIFLKFFRSATTTTFFCHRVAPTHLLARPTPRRSVARILCGHVEYLPPRARPGAHLAELRRKQQCMARLKGLSYATSKLHSKSSNSLLCGGHNTVLPLATTRITSTFVLPLPAARGIALMTRKTESCMDACRWISVHFQA